MSFNVKSVIFFVLFVGHFFVAANTMECGINLVTSKNLRDVIEKCTLATLPVVKKNPENATNNGTNRTNASDEDVMEDFKNYGPRRGLLVMDASTSNAEKREFDKKPSKMPSNTNNNSDIDNNGGNDISNKTFSVDEKNATMATNFSINDNNQKRCIVRCILQHYQMVNAKGFPELEKVANAILRITPANRELHDVIVDTVDDCFQSMSDYGGVALDSCTFSARLVTCLADKAKFNCADWPVGELPFPHTF